MGHYFLDTKYMNVKLVKLPGYVTRRALANRNAYTITAADGSCWFKFIGRHGVIGVGVGIGCFRFYFNDRFVARRNIYWRCIVRLRIDGLLSSIIWFWSLVVWLWRLIAWFWRLIAWVWSSIDWVWRVISWFWSLIAWFRSSIAWFWSSIAWFWSSIAWFWRLISWFWSLIGWFRSSIAWFWSLIAWFWRFKTGTRNIKARLRSCVAIFNLHRFIIRRWGTILRIVDWLVSCLRRIVTWFLRLKNWPWRIVCWLRRVVGGVISSSWVIRFRNYLNKNILV